MGKNSNSTPPNIVPAFTATKSLKTILLASTPLVQVAKTSFVGYVYARPSRAPGLVEVLIRTVEK